MINCPNCYGQVDATANYCVHCGNRMPVACSNCGAANQAESLYCHACGSGIGSAIPAEAAPASPPPPATCPRCHASNQPGTTFCYSCGYPLEELRTALPRPAGVDGTPAGFWIRLLAWLIDTVLLVALQLVLLTLPPGVSIESYFSEDSFGTWPDAMMTIASAVYYTVGVSVFSTTVGKRAFGLYVLRSDGSRVSGLRAFCRHLASDLSFLLLGIGYLVIVFNRDKRGLHDYICDTVVIKR